MNSGAEIAFFSLSYRDVKNLRTRQYPAAQRILSLVQEPRLLMSSLLMGNLVLRILVILLFNYLVTEDLIPGITGFLLFIIRLLIAIIVLVLFGELLPKVWASNNYIRFAYYSSNFVWLNYLLFKRPGKWMAGLTQQIEKALGKDDIHARIDQIDQAISMEADDVTSEEEKNILKGIAQFGNVTVRKAMRSRLDVQGMDESASFDELKKKVEEQQYSRFPVFKDSLDSITGILHAKDLIPHLDQQDDFNWRTLVRPAFFIHEQMLVEDLLKEFQSKRIHFAVVVDEFGGTDGIITMEDILEEIVGEIRDEYDDEDPINIRVDDFNYIFEGKMMINQALKMMRLPAKEFDQMRGDSETVAGLVLEIAGEIPKQNQYFL
jgi:gliding motility-associated protein GldE